MNDTKLAGALALVGGLLLMVLTPVLVLVLIVMVAVAAVESLAPDVGNLGDSVAGATTQCQPVGIRPLTVSGRTSLSGDIDLTAQQVTNAAIVIGVGRNRGIDEDLIQIAVQVAWGESRLKNLANDGSFTYPAGSRVMTATQWAAARTVAMTSLNLPHDGIGSDWDSVGLFQQRPQAGWGTVPELRNR